MLAICMIFGSSKIKESHILPIVITAGAAINTAFVWKSDKKSRQELPPKYLQQIEERLANKRNYC
ncbi:MAG: hypothetical protein ABI417_02940 [Coleofasciculaceae cyanobacterium]